MAAGLVHAALVLLSTTPPELVAAGQQTPRDFLADLVRAQVKFLNADAVDIRAALEEHFQAPIDDAESARAFRELVVDLLPDTEPGRWADPITTDQREPLRALLLDPDCPELTIRRQVQLCALREDQFVALHRAVFLSDGVRINERYAFGRRLRDEAARAKNEESAAALRERAETIEDRIPEELGDPHAARSSQAER